MNIIRIILDLIIKALGRKTQKKEEPKPSVKPAPVNVNTPKPKPTPPPPPPVEEKPLAPIMPITAEIQAVNLSLGHYDEGAKQEDIQNLLKLYHRNMPAVSDSIKLHKMRHGDLFDWVKLKPLPGRGVATLQAFLVNVGIMHPDTNLDGVFDYATQSGVRLFQEYIRIYENKAIQPTGIVNQETWAIMKEWQDHKKTAENWARGKASEEYKKWLKMIKQSQQHYQTNPHIITEKVNEMIAKLNQGSGTKVDTFPLGEWTASEDEIHLIGIRRKEDAAGAARKNDDVFILLINGLVFKFWGSTDPHQGVKNRKDEAFLSEGQHKFRFGWHNVSEGRNEKLYQGLNPFDRGVLVFRDNLQTNDNKLTETDIEKGLDSKPNTTINIHWTGIGDANRTTWSEGCQVIAGKSYIDPMGIKRDCSAFAASGSGDLQNNDEDDIVRTKGAYNVFSDLLLVFPKKRVDYLIYTLGRDETVGADFLAGNHGDQILASALKAFDLEQGGEGFA